MWAAWTATVLLAGLSLFQLALAGGAPIGRFAWGGGHDVLPPRLRIGSLVSILIYAVISAVLLARAGVWSWLPADIAGPLAWGIAGYFGLGIVLNFISRSPPERAAMTPLAAALCALSVVVALGP
ncbi:MAG: hypothetical protein ACO1OG_06590 [Devosia sp.]